MGLLDPVGFMGTMLDKLFKQSQSQDENEIDDQGNATAQSGATTKPLAPDTDNTQALAPIETDNATAPVVSRGRWVAENEQGGDTLYIEAKQHTERFRRLVDTFDEDKQEPIEWIIRKLIGLFCYTAPFLLAIPLGLAIGAAFVSGQSDVSMQFAIRLLCVFLEIAVPILGLSATITFKRALKDRKSIPIFLFVLGFFLLFAMGNGFALLFLLEKNGIALTNPPEAIGVLFRSFGPATLDLACTIYLAIASVRSLQKYLADQRQKVVAVKDVNAVNIELESANIKAATDRQAALMDMESKRKRQATWNKIEAMQGESMIKQAEKAFQGDGERSSYRRSSY